jgi:hypothetical protein
MYLEHKEVTVANGEIRVAEKNKVVYAAPTLICHYIEGHPYCPPSEFLDAVSKL